MNRYLTPRQFARAAAAGLVVLITALAIIYSRRGDDAGIVAPLEREQADALATELLRCRGVMPGDTASLENCRRVWTENRRQFFGPIKTPPSSIEPTPTPANESGKNQDRVSPAEAEHQQREVR
jgi:conjugative transfer region protein TrbK